MTEEQSHCGALPMSYDPGEEFQTLSFRLRIATGKKPSAWCHTDGFRPARRWRANNLLIC